MFKWFEHPFNCTRGQENQDSKQANKQTNSLKSKEDTKMEFAVRISNSIDSRKLWMKKYIDLPFPSVLQEIAHKTNWKADPMVEKGKFNGQEIDF